MQTVQSLKRSSIFRPTASWRRLLVWALVGFAVFSLGGCSGKPSMSDVASRLNEAYQCPILEVSEVKKLDGAAGREGAYAIAYSYQVSFKGDKAKAVQYFSDLTEAEERVQRSQFEYLRVRVTAGGYGDGVRRDAAIARVMTLKQTTSKQLEALRCQGGIANMILIAMRSNASENYKASPSNFKVPLAAKINASGVLIKTDNGWQFLQPVVTEMRITELVQSDPVQPTSSVFQPVWSEYTAADDVFFATVPIDSARPCSYETSTSGGVETSFRRCNFGDEQNALLVEYMPLPTVRNVRDPNEVLDDKVKSFAGTDQLANLVDITVNGHKGKGFTIKTASELILARIFVTDKYVIWVQAQNVSGKAGDPKVIQKFLEGVIPGVRPKA